MSVKVIHRGPDSGVLKEITCRMCGAVLQYAPIDVQQEKGCNETGGCEYINFIICPECHWRVATN